MRMTRKYRCIISSTQTQDTVDKAADSIGDDASIPKGAFQLWTTKKSYHQYRKYLLSFGKTEKCKLSQMTSERQLGTLDEITFIDDE